MTTRPVNPMLVEVLHRVVALLDHAGAQLWRSVDEDAGEDIAKQGLSDLALGIDLARSRAAALAIDLASRGSAIAGHRVADPAVVGWPSSAALALADAGRLVQGLTRSTVRPGGVDCLLDELADLLCQAQSSGC